MTTMLRRMLGHDGAPVALDADDNRYYVALINEASSEAERVAIGRAATRAARARQTRPGRTAGAARRIGSLVAG
ncbi:MAG TPA: hypothetical protein VHB30_00780 [Solirubrobacteraceae bacterium]|nr:hypothetical protein [Solirubrobacteraceae bacterium]